MARRIRKQVHESLAADLEAHACREYASDEEGRAGLDECAVRPLPLADLAGITPPGSVRMLAVAHAVLHL